MHRLMITYYNGNDHKIVDLTVNQAESISKKQVAEDCEDIVSVIEVLPGVDYDKDGYMACSQSEHFVRMMLER